MGFINTTSNLASALNTRQSAKNSKKHLAVAQAQSTALAAQTQTLTQQLEVQRLAAAQAASAQQTDHQFRYDTDEKYRVWYDQRAEETARQEAALAHLQQEQQAVAAQLAEIQRQRKRDVWLWIAWVIVPYVMIFVPPHGPPLRADWWLGLQLRWRLLIALAWIAIVVAIATTS